MYEQVIVLKSDWLVERKSYQHLANEK